MKLNELHLKLLEGMTPAEQASFREGLKALNMADPADRIALRESVKRLRPDFSEAQIDIFVNPEAGPKNAAWII